MEASVNNGQVTAQADPRTDPEIDAGRATANCGAGFFRSIQKVFCPCYVNGSDNIADQIVEDFRPDREIDVHQNEQHLQVAVLQEREEKVNQGVDEYLSSLGNSAAASRSQLLALAMYWVSNKSPEQEISAKLIFETEEVEPESGREAKCRVENFEEQIQSLSYQNFPEYKPATPEELSQAEECCLSGEPSDNMIRYRNSYFCDYDVFLTCCRSTQWLDPFTMEGAVDLGEIQKVKLTSLPFSGEALPFSGEVNLGYEPEGIEEAEVMNTRL